MNYSDIQSLPAYTTEMLNEIMKQEERHQQKEIENQARRGQFAQKKYFRKK